ncbi:MAG: YbaK/EbsC family protein [Candidatus Nanohaloarchaea archaeon]
MKAHNFLEGNGLDFEVVEQDNPTKDCDDAAQERGVETSQIVKSLIVERHKEKGVKKGDLIHVLLPGDREISEKKFGEHHLISPEKSKELTGFESGTVHPFSTEIEHVIDYRVLENEEVSFTVGEQLKGVIINSKEFRKGLEKSNFDYEIKDISLTKQEDIDLLESESLDKEDAMFVADKGLAPLYLELNYDSEDVIKSFQELLRRDIRPEKEIVTEIIEASENLNHLQKLVETYAETGKIEDSGSFELEEVIDEILDENSEALEDLKEGKQSVENFIIGQVMQRTSGRARPERVKEVLNNEFR